MISRKFVIALIATFLFITSQTITYAAAAPAVAITAPSGILINSTNGDILWQRRADQKRSIASTTKMMTTIIALERCNLDETVTVGSDAVKAGLNGGINVALNEQLQLRDLLYATMLYSANDAAVAVADHVAGTQVSFARLMNAKARQIECTGTRFSNASGLPDKLNYSTAHDLAYIAQYALQNPMFSRLVDARIWKLTRQNPKKPAYVENRNKLLWDFTGANGVKTGHTKEAGYCLVSSARRGDISLITVILGAPSYKSVFNQSARLLDFGFSNYKNKVLIKKETIYKVLTTRYNQRIELVAADTVSGSVRLDMLAKHRS